MTDKYERRLLLLTSALLALGMLLGLGIAPLYLEEPRRALVALEMWHSGNYWAPTLLGEWYYNKPPLYNWVLVLFDGGTGKFQEFWLRLPTVLSVFATAALMYFAGKRHVHALFGARAALLFLCFGNILFYFSPLAEIDLFYTLLVFGSILAIEFWGERQQHLLLFTVVYLLCAMGVLTKGLPSLAFTAISLLVYFAGKRRMAVLYSPAHIVGILLLVGLLGAYTWQYAQYNPPDTLLQTLLGESSRRTVAGAATATGFLMHLLSFPLDVFKDFLPAGIAVLFLWRRDLRDFLFNRHPFIRFCTWMLLANAALYWISPGTRIRYVYPLFPLAAFLLAWAYEGRQEAPVWAGRWFVRLSGVLLIGLLAGAIALPFIPDLAFLPYRIPLATIASLAFALLLIQYLKKPGLSLACLLLALAVGRIVFDLTIFPQRASNTEAQRNKALAEDIHRLTNDAPLYLHGEEKVISYTTSFYLSRLRRQPIRYQDQLQTGQYYLLPTALVTLTDSVLLELEYEGIPKALIRRRVVRR